MHVTPSLHQGTCPLYFLFNPWVVSMLTLVGIYTFAFSSILAFIDSSFPSSFFSMDTMLGFIFIFIVCKAEHFDMSLSFFIKPRIIEEMNHSTSFHKCTEILIPYFENDNLQLLPVCFHIFIKGEVHDMTLNLIYI